MLELPIHRIQVETRHKDISSLTCYGRNIDARNNGITGATGFILMHLDDGMIRFTPTEEPGLASMSRGLRSSAPFDRVAEPLSEMWQLCHEALLRSTHFAKLFSE